MPEQGTFKSTYTFEERFYLSSEFFTHKHTRIPFVLEHAPTTTTTTTVTTTNINNKNKHKNKKNVASRMSAEKWLTVGQFMFSLRKRLQVKESEAIFVYVGDHGVLVPGSETFGALWQRYKDPDGLLYLIYAAESTFG